MCLYSVSETPTKKTGIGYKIFKYHKGELIPLFGCPFTFKPYVWNKDIQDYYVYSTTDDIYPTGFHAFVNYNSAIKFAKLYKDTRSYDKCILTIWKVKYNDIVAYGEQRLAKDKVKCVVSKKIKPLKQIDIIINT